MLEAFGGSDNPPAVATRTWCAPAAALFGGRSLHGRMHGAPRHCLSLWLRSPLLDVSVSLSVSRFPVSHCRTGAG